MKKPFVILFTAIMMLSLISIPTAAAVPTNQGLDWAVEQGDKFYYHIEIYDLTETNPLGVINIAEDIYMNLTDPLPSLSDDMTDYTSLLVTYPEFFYLNDTIDTFFGLALLGPTLGLVKPVGNWGLLGDLYEDESNLPLSPANITLDVDDWLHFGYTINTTQVMSMGPFPTFTADILFSSEFLKTDGVLSAFSYTINNASSPSNNLVISVTAERDGVLPVVTSPDDVSFVSGTTGNELNWSATDQSPAGYIVTVDGVEVSRGLWNSTSENITLSLDDFEVGVYECEVYFYEASGLYITDAVNVTVTAPPGFPIDQYLPIILIAAGIGVVVIIVIVLRRK